MNWFVYLCNLNDNFYRMKQMFAVARKAGTFAVVWWVALMMMPSCKTDSDDVDLSDEGTNSWIYEVMTDYYLWYDDIPDKGNLNFSQSPDAFFASLLSDEDGVTYNGGWLTFSQIEEKETTTKSITASDSYGFDFASYKSGNYYYAWVLYVLPDSPAETAGLKRGDWILAVGSDSPNVTSTSAFYSGGATTLLVADDLTVHNNTVSFGNARSVSIEASRAVEDTPFLKDSVYTIAGKNIGYLMYNTFSSGPDNEDETYNDRLKDIFAGFKAQNVSEFILDLRYNPGGLLTSAQLMTSFLVPSEYLGDTFCKLEYNDKLASSNRDLAFLSNSELGNANLDLDRIYILTGNMTASASEAVINCLIPYMGRDNITLIGRKTVGKRVGSNTFGEDEDYGWLLHPIILRIYNANSDADYANGFSPDVEVNELVVGNELLPFGDTDELLLGEAIAQITGQTSSYSLKAASSDAVSLVPALGRKKVKGLIY